MPEDALPPLRMYLELVAEQVLTLKVNHPLSPDGREYVRCFIECHASLQVILAAAREYVTQHGGDAREVPNYETAAPLITVSLPLVADAATESVVVLVSQLFFATERAVRTT